MIAPVMGTSASFAADLAPAPALPILAEPGWENWGAIEFGGQAFIDKPGNTRSDNLAKFEEYGNRTNPVFMPFIDLGASAKALGGGQIDKNSVAQYIGTALGGPAASLLGQFADANNEHLQGDDWKAAELLMPKVARDISRAIRYAQQGVTTASSNPLVMPSVSSAACARTSTPLSMATRVPARFEGWANTSLPL